VSTAVARGRADGVGDERALSSIGHEPSRRPLVERRSLGRGRARGNLDVPHLPREQVEPQGEPSDPSGPAVAGRSVSSPGLLPQPTARQQPRPPLAMRERAASSPHSPAAPSRYEPLAKPLSAPFWAKGSDVEAEALRYASSDA